MKIVYFILGLSFLIFFHELGHFLFAKLFKVYVYEFSLFMGPKLLQKKIGETKYSLRLLPIGGYVSMAGENDSQSTRNKNEEEEEKALLLNNEEEIKETEDVLTNNVSVEEKKVVKERDDLPEVPYERTLPGIANWKKLLIMFAGPLFNFILCFILMVAYFAVTPTTKVNVSENSIAYQAGLRSDDTINDIYVLFYDGDYDEDSFVGGAYRKNVDAYKNLNMVNNAAYGYLYKELVEKYTDVSNFPETINYEVRLALSGQEEMIHIYSAYNVTLSADNKSFDHDSLPTLVDLGINEGNETLGLVRSIGKSASTEVKMAGAIYEALGNLFTKEGINSMAGPVGMYSIATSYMEEGFVYYLYFIAMISVNLGIINLLPFPALDGGKMVLTIAEMITRKKVPAKAEAILNFVGFAILMALMLAITFKDIFFPSV